MRYLFLTGALSLVLAGGLAVIKAGDAFGQQPRAESSQLQRSPVPRPSTAYIIGQQAPEAAAETDEMGRLHGVDAQLSQQAEALVKQLAETPDENDRAKLKASLEATLTQQFDSQQKVRELEVAAIEAKVKKLRDVISKRNDARRTIIEKRLDQLLREADGLGWNSPTGGPVAYSNYGQPLPSGFPGGGLGQPGGYPAVSPPAGRN